MISEINHYFLLLNAMQLIENDIHIWIANLNLAAKNEKTYFATLNEDECVRANRFHLPIHRERFIASHGVLRQLLGSYLHLSPKEILYDYNEYKKPFIAKSLSQKLQFNLSHSENLAIYAFTLEHSLGIDIEKIQTTFSPALCKRFFSKKENDALDQLSAKDKIIHFYHIWSRKEALIKAVGKGLHHPLASFSVCHPICKNEAETIELENKTWYLLSLEIKEGYEVALATTQEIDKNNKNVYFWDFFDQLDLASKENVGK